MLFKEWAEGSMLNVDRIVDIFTITKPTAYRLLEGEGTPHLWLAYAIYQESEGAVEMKDLFGTRSSTRYNRYIIAKKRRIKDMRGMEKLLLQEDLFG